MIRQGLSKLFYYLNLGTDILVVSAAFLAAYYLRFCGWPIPLRHNVPEVTLYLQAMPIVIGVTLICFQYAGLYIQRRGISGVDEFPRIFKALTVAFLIIVGLSFFYRRVTYSRIVLFYAWGFTLVLTVLARSWLRRIQISLRRRGVGISRLALVGMTETAYFIADQVKRFPGLGYRLIGFVTDQKNAGLREQSPGPGRRDRVLGSLNDLNEIIRQERIDEVVFALPATAHARTAEALLTAQFPGVEFKIVSDLFGIITNPMTMEEISGIPVFALKEAPLSKPLSRILKRGLDLVCVVPAIILLSPLLLILGLAIKFSSAGPVFFRQERVGRGNQPFTIFKFRSMRQDAENSTGPVWARKEDVRRTRIGRFLRKTSLDELPQLFNVLKGEMSLVGPRPERPHFVKQFEDTIPRYLDRHQVKAGITGWAQIHGLRGNTPIEERTKYDLWYVENWSLALDLKLLIQTLLDVFHHKEAY
jgi:exopolysaccharide biosynthesis polyprenyl glycosylphosphotransferase